MIVPRARDVRRHFARRPGAPDDLLLVRQYSGGAQLRVNPPWAVLHLEGEIDIATAPGFRQAAGDLAATAEQDPGLLTDVLVDLRAVTFLDSAGMAVLARLVREAAARGWRLRLLGLRPAVRTALGITGLLELLPEQATGELPSEARRALV
ncbi:MAG: STAS domain-containing protein [Actinomycetota bacterium]|nr:STAS domain-containing protein [Actinomycetota bacterium]